MIVLPAVMRPASVILIFALIVACVPQQRRTDELVSDIGRTGSAPIADVLVLLPTIGAETREASLWEPPAPKFDNEKFSQLLFGALGRSGLFRKIVTHAPGDFELRSEIIFQETIPGLNSTFLLLIRYELKETAEQRTVWKEHLFTRKDFRAQQAFSGGHNVVRLMEEAYVANLEDLIDRLAAEMGP